MAMFDQLGWLSESAPKRAQESLLFWSLNVQIFPGEHAPGPPYIGFDALRLRSDSDSILCPSTFQTLPTPFIRQRMSVLREPFY